MRIAIAGATGRIGAQLTALARTEGHDVVEIARETGFDLLSPDSGLEQALTGADAVVDVTACPLDQAATFFPTRIFAMRCLKSHCPNQCSVDQGPCSARWKKIMTGSSFGRVAISFVRYSSPSSSGASPSETRRSPPQLHA